MNWVDLIVRILLSFWCMAAIGVLVSFANDLSATAATETLLFSNLSFLSFRFCYRIGVALWFGLVITLIVLSVRLARLGRLRNEFQKLEKEMNDREV